MLFKTGLVLLMVWLVGILGLFQAGDIVHVLLLVGLMLVMLGVLKSRDAAIAADRRIVKPPDK